jgi:hypothetical protein
MKHINTDSSRCAPQDIPHEIWADGRAHGLDNLYITDASFFRIPV